MPGRLNAHANSFTVQNSCHGNVGIGHRVGALVGNREPRARAEGPC